MNKKLVIYSKVIEKEEEHRYETEERISYQQSLKKLHDMEAKL